MTSNAGRGLTPELFKTSEAARLLGVSGYWLKDNRDICGGFLVVDKHWIPGITPTSPIRWNVPLVLEAMRYHGMNRVKCDQLLGAKK